MSIVSRNASLAICGLMTASFVSPAFAGDSIVTATVDTGVMNLMANEMVYWGNFKASELDWESKNVAVLRGSLDIAIASEWSIKAKGQIALSEGNGDMTDYDWIPPYYIDTTKSGWSHRSTHPDTGLDHYYSAGLELNRKFVDDFRSTLSGGIGVRYTDVQWTARGGSYIYSVSSTRDTSGTIPDGTRGITYRQQIPTLYAHVDGSQRYGRFTIDGGLEAGLAIAAKATDDHWLRDLRFEDDFDIAPVLGASLGASYLMTPNLSFYVTSSIDYTKFSRGDTETFDTTTGDRTNYEDAAGATLRAIYVGAGVKGSF